MVFILFFLLFFPPDKSSAERVEKIHAQVGSEIITQSDLKKFRSLISMNLMPPSFLLKEVYGKNQLLKNRKKLLEFLVLRHKLYDLAIKKNLPEIPEKGVERQIDKIRGKRSPKTFKQRLRQAGLTSSFLKKQVLIDSRGDSLLLQSVLSKVSVFEEEIESRYFNKHQKALFKNFEYEFVSLSFSEEQKSAVLQMLNSGIKELKDLAQALKLETKTFQLKDREIQELFKKELEKLSISQMSPVLFAGDSYYILELKWKKPIIRPGEEAKKIKIEQALYQQKRQEGLRQWIREQKKDFFMVPPFL